MSLIWCRHGEEGPCPECTTEREEQERKDKAKENVRCVVDNTEFPLGGMCPECFPNHNSMNVSATGGLRDNKGKPALSLVPRSLLVAVASVIWKSSKDGGGKYPLHNWRKGLYWRDTADCAIRHIYAWLEGEECDKETGLHHLWHAACNLAFLIEYVITHPNLDNRYKTSPTPEEYK